MSLFGVDLNEVPDDPFAAPLGTWEAVLIDVDTFDSKDGTATYLKLTWQNVADQNTMDDIFTLKDSKLETPGLRKKHSFWKARLLELQVPESRMNEINSSIEALKDALVGTKAYITTVKNGQYTNIKKVVLWETDSEEAPF